MTENDTGLKAASARFRKLILGQSARNAKQDSSRQANAYAYWDDTPEVRFSGLWVGRAMSKARLFAARRTEDGEIVPADEGHPSIEFVSNIAGGPGGQSQLLEQFGPHLVVAGEGWIVIVPQEDGSDQWFALSVNEVDRSSPVMVATVVTDGEERQIKVPPAGEDNDDPLAPLAIRIWNPHPARYSRADSPVMSSSVILDELRLLNAAVAAIAKSRCLGRGILFMPQGAKLPDGDDLLDRILDVAELAYKEPASAAAGVPILAEVPNGSDTFKPMHMKFELDFDELAVKLREEAIRRYATASDTPAEVLLGQADINHWGVWAIRDEAIEVGIEPRLATFCEGVTTQGMWPDLQSKNVADWRDHLVWYDTSGLRVRTNRSQTAIELGQANVISSNAVRRETDFDDSDAPSAATTRLRAYLNAASVVPTLAADATVQARIVELLQAVDAEAEEPGEGNGTEVELPVDETQGPPSQEPTDEVPASGASDDTLSAAIDGLIVRALERAGNKLRSSRPRSEHPKLTDLRASAFHTVLFPNMSELSGLRLLEGAWDRAPEIATRYDVREDCLIGLLDAYTRDLLLSGATHTYDAVPGLVREATCLQPA